MQKTVSFLSGIQRSGSTLLTKVMNQHPLVFASNTSPLFDYLFFSVEKLAELKATSSAAHYINEDVILQSVIDAFYSFTTKPHVIDKHRAWASNYFNVNKQIQKNPKMIVTLRPVEEVVSSFNTILQKNGTPTTIAQIYKDFLEEHIPDMIDSTSAIDYFLVVTYDQLTNEPVETFKRIEEYLELPPHTYNFQQIIDNDPENDVKWGIKNLHAVRTSLSVESVPPQDVMTAAELAFFQKQTQKLYRAFRL